MHFQYANNIHVLKQSEFLFIYRPARTQIKRNVTVVFPFYYSVINKRGFFFLVHPKETAGFNFVESSIRLSYAYKRWPNLSKAKKMYTTPTNGHKIAKFWIYISPINENSWFRCRVQLCHNHFTKTITLFVWQLGFITCKEFLKIWQGLIYWSTDCSAVKRAESKRVKAFYTRIETAVLHNGYPRIWGILKKHCCTKVYILAVLRF